MPIKIPKAFGRRKSTDKALEEVENPPEPSFRVFERPAGGSKSFDAGSRLKALSGARPESVPNNKNSNNHAEVERIFSGRGSGGSKNSASTGGYYDTSSSSARLSSSSTLPSSNDAHTPDESYFPRSTKPLPHVPIPPIPHSKPGFSLGGRTFSFGGAKAPKPSESSAPSPPPSSGAVERRYQPSHSGPSYNGDSSSKRFRDRAMTESSYASTTTPPKLDTQLSLGSSDMDGFGNMFASFGKRKSTLMEDGEPKFMDSPTAISPGAISPGAPAVPPKTYSNQRLSHAAPAPVSINATHLREVEPSPYSWGSHNSNDGLMSSMGRDSGPPTPSHGNIRALTPSSTMPVKSSPSGLLGGPRPQRPTEGGLKRSSGYGPRRPSLPFEDEDAKLVAANRQSRPNGTGLRSQADRFRENNWEDQRTSPSPDRSSDTKSSNQSSRSGSGKENAGAELFDSQPATFSGRTCSPINSKSPKLTPGPDDQLFDTSFASSAKLAAQFEEHLNSPQRQAEEKKVMTPAQFERYRAEQEVRSKMDASKSDDSDDDDAYDDEDETERNRLAAKQRQKQEAHLTLYRQQMMKVTGEQPSQVSNFAQRQSVANFGSSSSLPNLSTGLSTINLNVESKDEGKGSDDSDEDIPLGILAAHGFPNKNRPPGFLASAASNPNLRASSQMSAYPPPPPPRSVTGDAAAQSGGSGKLPPFARNLPRDPYFGAGLVNPSNRESLAFSHNGRSSVYGGGLPAPGMSLVNVIENEERSRAMRRGSPNSAAVGNRGGSPGGGLLGMGAGAGMGGPQMPGIGGMPMGPFPGMPMGMGGMPMMPPGDQMQMQMTQQMTQMMQMQMEWMDKMMAIQQMQTGQQTPPSVGKQENSFLGVPGQRAGQQSLDPQMHQRTMSMLDSGTSKWTRPANYRASTFAPSVNGRTPGDQAYAPSIAPSERSTVGLPSRYRPVSHVPAAATSNRASTFTSGISAAWQDKQAPSQSKMQQVKGADGNSDEDDDEGWEEMKKRRERKRSNWRNKSDKHALKELFFSGD